jgi:hypothetical protein
VVGKVVCTRRHSVDRDLQGTTRYAEVGWVGEVERTNAEYESLPYAYVVTWPNESWGFYSKDELAEVARRAGREEVGK